MQAKSEAAKVAEKIDGRNVVILRQASETGQLFGSVSVRDIITSFQNDGVSISRSQVMLDAPIKTIGKHEIAIAVHPEVEVGVTVTVARSADEAERINRGEDISTRQEDRDAAAEAIAAAGEFFDPEALPSDLGAAAEPRAGRVSRSSHRSSKKPGRSAGLLFSLIANSSAQDAELLPLLGDRRCRRAPLRGPAAGPKPSRPAVAAAAGARR